MTTTYASSAERHPTCLSVGRESNGTHPNVGIPALTTSTGDPHVAYAQGLYPDRASDRRGHYRHSGRDRDSEVREHEGKGVSGVREVGSAQHGDVGRGVLLRQPDVYDRRERDELHDLAGCVDVG